MILTLLQLILRMSTIKKIRGMTAQSLNTITDHDEVDGPPLLALFSHSFRVRARVNFQRFILRGCDEGCKRWKEERRALLY